MGGHEYRQCGGRQGGRPVATAGRAATRDILQQRQPTYFETMRVPLLRAVRSRPSITKMRRRSPLSTNPWRTGFGPTRIQLGSSSAFRPLAQLAKTMQVVGVAGNGRYLFIAEDPHAVLLCSLCTELHFYARLTGAVVRYTGNAAKSMQAEIHKLAPDLPVTDARTMKRTLGGSNGLEVFRLGAQVSAAIGIDWIDPGGGGIYGIVSFSVPPSARAKSESGWRSAAARAM